LFEAITIDEGAETPLLSDRITPDGIGIAGWGGVDFKPAGGADAFLQEGFDGGGKEVSDLRGDGELQGEAWVLGDHLSEGVAIGLGEVKATIKVCFRAVRAAENVVHPLSKEPDGVVCLELGECRFSSLGSRRCGGLERA
jgi:hypothetical protein